jgi:hypothetical protein
MDVAKIVPLSFRGNGKAGSFVITHGGHVGIGSLPIVYFSNHEQKKYLPDVATCKNCGVRDRTRRRFDALALKTSDSAPMENSIC